MAAVDLVGILVCRFPTRSLARKEWARWITDCEKRAAKLNDPPPFPEPWAPVEARILEDFLREIQVVELGERLGAELRSFPGRKPESGWPPRGLFDFGMLEVRLHIDRERKLREERPETVKAEYEDVRQWIETHLGDRHSIAPPTVDCTHTKRKKTLTPIGRSSKNSRRKQRRSAKGKPIWRGFVARMPP